MRDIIVILRAVYNLSRSLHNPLNHDLIKDQKLCPTCKFNAKLSKLIDEGEVL